MKVNIDLSHYSFIKILLIVFKIFKGSAPSYLSFLITPKNLRSSSDSTLLSYPNVIPKATLGERTFLFAAPKLWNGVPRFIRESISVDTFKRKLRLTFLIFSIESFFFCYFFQTFNKFHLFNKFIF